MYNEKIIELFQNPKNHKKIENPDGIGKYDNPICGDSMWISIKVGKNDKGEEIISDIGVQTFGCIAAIASSSEVTELAKGKTLEEAKKITRADISEHLGGLPPIKEHCSNLAVDALKKAIEDYEGKK